jgi:hypothetical protein
MTAGARSLLLSLAVGAMMTGCGGDRTSVQSETHTTTIGQELLDLDRALDRGLITEREYERAKEDILRRYEE